MSSNLSKENLSSKKLKAIGVIPARYGSTRFPGKPLVMIAGKPLLQWVIEGSKTSRKLSKIFVATDDDRIAALARASGAEAVMTDSDLPTGTDRVFAASKNEEFDVVINIQGDEPLISGELLDRLIAPFEEEAGLSMATLGRPLDDESLQSVNTAKIVLNKKDEAIYFSRYPIPYSRVKTANDFSAAMKHIGIYAYRKEFLKEFCAQKPTLLEEKEGLEQLRALYLGARIKVVKVENDSWGVDTPEDVKKIEEMIRQRGNR